MTPAANQNPRRGRFITLEGGEGVGKSTNLAFAASVLEAAGIDVMCTREPGGTPLAERVRELIVTPCDETMPPFAELLLMFAARAIHIENCIRPALESGRWVLCDRFTDASYAYQGAARGLGEEPVQWLEDHVQGGLRPDLTLLLDADPETGLARARARDHSRSAADRFEQERLAFFRRVREEYLARARAEAGRFCTIDATQSLQQVQADLRNYLMSFIEHNE